MPLSSSAPDIQPLHIAIVAFDDFTDIDLIFIWDLLNRVHLPHWKVRILGEASFHRSMTGLTISTHGPLSEANTADAVLFTSGKGTRLKIQDEEYLAQFNLNPERQLIGSICSGALMLAALGLLQGKQATTYPSAKPLLSAYGVHVIEKPLVIEGNIATAGGCLSAQYLAGWIIERLVGADIANAVIKSCQPVGEGLFFDTPVEAPQHVTPPLQQASAS
ncbi:MAG: DJ-1/PfpI family protein [Pseudomonadota bacterium]